MYYTTDEIEEKYYPKVSNKPSITKIDQSYFIDNNGFLRIGYGEVYHFNTERNTAII